MMDFKDSNDQTSVVISRIVTWSLPLFLGIIGWFIVHLISGVDESVTKLWTYVGTSVATINEIKSDVKVGNANFASHAKDDDNFSAGTRLILQDHENRLRTLQAPRSAPP